MFKFLLKSGLFIFPILILQVLTWVFYTPNKGDLLRIGYVADWYPEYRSQFAKEYQKENGTLSITDLEKDQMYDLLTIGDSFSEQGNTGYQNYLATDFGLDVVHIDRKYHTNQIQTLVALASSDFFELYRFRFALLQFVEAGTHGAAPLIQEDSILGQRELSERELEKADRYTDPFVFPSDRVLKFPYYTLKRTLFPSLGCNQVYMVNLNASPFSIPNQQLYFHASNPNWINNNDEKDISDLNELLNRLSKKLESKGVQLMVLPVPDKLDFYHEDLKEQDRWECTRFFEILGTLKNEYHWINTLEQLKQSSVGLKDVYYFDDTHWSPVGAKLIAKIIASKIKIMDNGR
ncbi:alginate O-acetyltransferase AlgX-related protein [Mongoliitalea lutea]|uniref:AlgX/AlgJ SGNH hydrolase-like domain-containing protein n=1 Tax=Mongoliitalea lutea TaxID=849756 RepID=A0A8J3CV13_9BACT|nr:hypothetical protein [Mongoliitalea lutea]GHB23856.1 hypothetical protein GCM10008106_00590 [Mongoliitalea lutea]